MPKTIKTFLSFLRLKKKELLLATVSTILGLVFVIFITEIYFHKTYWHSKGTQFDSELGWKNIPNAVTFQVGKKQTTNSHGFRSPEVNSEKKHILMLGDSVVWGYGVGDNENVSHFLGKLNDNFQVLNLGVPGYGIGQYYLRLRKHISALNPRLIIVTIYSGNDVSNTARGEAYGKSKPVFVLNKNSLILLNKRVSRFSCDNLVSRYWILHKVFGNYRKEICKQIGYKQYFDVREVIIGLLKKFETLAKNHSSKILFVIAPSRDDLTQKVLSAEKESKFKSNYYKDRFANVIKYFEINPSKVENFNIYNVLDAMGEYRLKSSNHRFFQKIFQSNSFLFLDLLEAFPKKTLSPAKAYSYYLDPDHFSSLGNKLFAQKIQEVIQANKLLSSSK